MYICLIHNNTKSKLDKLDFVKEHSYDEIINVLISNYDKNIKKRNNDTHGTL